jgi:hypothetical protein
LHTPSPGDKHRQGVGLRGPVQRRRECGTLSEMGSIVAYQIIDLEKSIMYSYTLVRIIYSLWGSSILNHLITDAQLLLYNGDFEYAICGGYAIELFLQREIRTHGDIDVSVYWNERDKVILYMKSLGWDVYEMCGNGMAHFIKDINNQMRIKRNIFCIKDDCELVKISPSNESDMYYIEFDRIGQTKLNFIEFLFNNRSEDEFIYARNERLTRSLSKAIMVRNNIPYLSPELVLLYKSTDIEREGYWLDYREVICMMNWEQKQWLISALNDMYPSGHPWVNVDK